MELETRSKMLKSVCRSTSTMKRKVVQNRQVGVSLSNEDEIDVEETKGVCVDYRKV